MKPTTAIALALITLAGQSPAEDPAEARKKLADEEARLTAALAASPDSTRLLSRRGDVNLFLGRFRASVADFEKSIALDPALDAPHWRLGIAYFFADEFEKSSKQFVKYHAYDGRDRENGIWKFLADAKRHGLEKARTRMLEYTQFDREPFPSLYEMFAGRKSGDDVLAELKAKGLEADGPAAFFARYYVALNEDLLGRRERARELIAKALDGNWGRTAEGGPAYMWRVARLHAETLKAPAPRSP